MDIFVIVIVNQSDQRPETDVEVHPASVADARPKHASFVRAQPAAICILHHCICTRHPCHNPFPLIRPSF